MGCVEKETETDREQKDGDSLCFKVGFICRLCSPPDGPIRRSDQPVCVCVHACAYAFNAPGCMLACLCAKV